MGKTSYKIINWWEDELSSDERNKIMVNKSWSDIGSDTPEGIKKRQSWLRRAYKKYHKIYPKSK